ncbi:MAG: type III pantothenate kinase [Chitinophagaceae bacterium]
MPTSLCFDFGNTRQKCAVFVNHQLQEVIVLPNLLNSTIDGLLQQYQPEESILSSVMVHPTEINELLAQKTKFHLLSHASKLPFATPVGKPETIGADRLALCAAASHLYPQHHCLIIGLGTCITYNFLNVFAEFLGGSISPGMHMRFKAMHEQTALLPLVKAEHDFPLVGYDTKTNLQSGVLLGMAKEIDGMIDAYKEKYNNLKVLITGGDMQFFMHHVRNEVHADLNLLFVGLYAIGRANFG